MGHTASKIKGSMPFGRGNTFGEFPVGSDGNILVADSSGPSGVNWSSSLLTVGAGVGISGFWMYGTGVDGNVTLVGFTTLAAGDSVKNYNNLDLAGFNLTIDTTDFYGVIYVKDTLTSVPGGGVIHASARGSGTTNAGGAGGLTSGGTGGPGAAAIFVFAKNVTGTLQVAAAGGAGTAGITGDPLGPAPGSGAEYSDIVFKAKAYPSPPTPPNPQGGFHFGPGAGFGGDGSGLVVSTANRQEIRRTATDWIRMVVMNGFSDYTAAAPSPDERWNRSNGGGGGASGMNAGPGGMVVIAGGGGGGGGAGIIGDGGNGGGAAAVAIDLNPAFSASTGAGGGASGAGGVAILVSDTVTAAIMVNASGGIGGAGGAGSGGSLALGAPGGGGGGGGGGGYALAVVRSGAAFVTAFVPGGTGGLGGAGAAPGGTPGASGTAGSPGLGVVLASA